MKNIYHIIQVTGFALFLILIVPYIARGAQSENPVSCDEGVISEPIQLNYGDHTINCGTSPATELDTFTIVGSQNDLVRISIRGLSYYFDPVVEVREPVTGSVIDIISCSTTYYTCSASKDITLPESGEYRLIVYDSGNNETGNYTLQIEKISPVYDPPSLSYNSTQSDSNSPNTDLDFLTFMGEAGTDIRITVLSTSYYYDPKIEIWDPNGVLITTALCSTTYYTCSFTKDISLTTSGVYLIVISDSGYDEDGNYQISLNCLWGNCPTVLPPGVSCDIQMNQSSYVDGDIVTAQVFRLANTGHAARKVEIKTWVETPDGSSLPMVNKGADRSIILPPGYDQDHGPKDISAVTPDHVRGFYKYNCRILDPITGRELTLDKNRFEVK